jgi:hypothetical protein
MNAASSAAGALRTRRGELTDLLKTRLHSSTALHYRDAELDLLEQRCSRLVLAFLRSMEDEPTQLAQYLRMIAADRFDEGVALTELQLVLHILESHAWKICDETVESRDGLVHALGRVSGVIGHGKDALAQVYLDSAMTTRRELRDARRKLETLAGGTTTAVLAE